MLHIRSRERVLYFRSSFPGGKTHLTWTTAPAGTSWLILPSSFSTPPCTFSHRSNSPYAHAPTWNRASVLLQTPCMRSYWEIMAESIKLSRLCVVMRRERGRSSLLLLSIDEDRCQYDDPILYPSLVCPGTKARAYWVNIVLKATEKPEDHLLSWQSFMNWDFSHVFILLPWNIRHNSNSSRMTPSCSRAVPLLWRMDAGWFLPLAGWDVMQWDEDFISILPSNIPHVLHRPGLGAASRIYCKPHIGEVSYVYVMIKGSHFAFQILSLSLRFSGRRASLLLLTRDGWCPRMHLQIKPALDKGACQQYGDGSNCGRGMNNVNMGKNPPFRSKVTSMFSKTHRKKCNAQSIRIIQIVSLLPRRVPTRNRPI